MKSLRVQFNRATSGDWGYIFVGALTFLTAGISRLLGAHPHPEMLTDATISSRMHLLSADLLRHHLWQSIINLHATPPLFNLQAAALIHLPSRNLMLWLFEIACAAITAVATYGLIRHFGTPQRISVVVVAIYICCDPARLIYANYFSYDQLTAALVTVIAWLACISTYLPSRRRLRVLWWSVAILTLYNSNYSIYVLILVLVPALWQWRRYWRHIVKVGVVPLLCISLWYANDIFRFHQATTSSWVGSNLARNTLMLAPVDDVNKLIHERVLGPIALIRPFDYPKAYRGLVYVAPSGIPARDRKMDLFGAFPAANFNWDGYRALSALYLENDLSWIVHRPTDYARNVARTQFFWNLPLSQFYLVEVTPGSTLAGYTSWFNRYVEWQPRATDNAAGWLVVFHRYPNLMNISWLAVLESLLAIVAFPMALLWSRRRGHFEATWFVPWLMLFTTFIATSLVEVSENNRFRFETGGLPLALSVITVTVLVQQFRNRQTRRLVSATPSTN